MSVYLINKALGSVFFGKTFAGFDKPVDFIRRHGNFHAPMLCCTSPPFAVVARAPLEIETALCRVILGMPIMKNQPPARKLA